MTANKRIFLNIVATYGRSLYALICGLFTARWVLMALGEVDYGLFGVVAGLTSFVAFFNGLLSGAISRFYAFSVGQATTFSSSYEGIEGCRKWFSIAVAIHTIVPLLLTIIGYPIGEWAVRNWLTIPFNRIEACVWVWRFVCVSCFIGMVNTPFTAMYTAKQYIAELTIYSFVTTTLNVCFLYYIATSPGDWLVVFALWTMLILIIPQIMIAIRACVIFPECHFRWCYLRDKSAFRELFTFATHRMGGAIAVMMQTQGMVLLVNKLLGPNWNASMTIGQSVASHSETLSAALDNALMPAITNSCGANDQKRMLTLIFISCKVGAILMAIFAIPLALEIEEVMHLWLKTPPNGAASLCVYLLGVLLLEKLSTGHYVAIFASGKIGAYQLAMSVCGLFSLPMAFLFFYGGMGLDGVGLALVITKGLTVLGRLYYGKKIVNISPRCWFSQIFLPVVLALGGTLVVGWMPKFFLSANIWRVCITTLCCEVTFLPLVWTLVFKQEERSYVREKVNTLLVRLGINIKSME